MYVRVEPEATAFGAAVIVTDMGFGVAFAAGTPANDMPVRTRAVVVTTLTNQSRRLNEGTERIIGVSLSWRRPCTGRSVPYRPRPRGREDTRRPAVSASASLASGVRSCPLLRADVALGI